MTPYLGQGATNAMVDALTLAEKLKSAQHGNEEERKQQTVTERVGDYESSMLKRGNAVVKNSLYALHVVYTLGNTSWRAWFRNLALSFWDLLMPHPTDVIEPFPGMFIHYYLSALSTKCG
jgi:2-polyprenyl-6-methoxyphenol hydroxylase-like FAD-dependent oxidoreductase